MFQLKIERTGTIVNRIVTIKSNDIEKSIKTKKILSENLIKRGFKVIDYLHEKTELIISIGGDGSFLKIVNTLEFTDKLFVGINTGHLGFFTDVTVEEIDKFIDLYISKSYIVQSLPILNTKIITEYREVNIYTINEVVIKCDKSKVIHANINIDGNKIQKISGDGIIISTPTGSTAHNYSARGSIVDPSMNVIQLTSINHLNTNVYRSFSSSILFSFQSELEVVPEYSFEKSMLIVVDGVEYKFERVIKIKTQMTNQKINLFRMPNYNFWSRVSSKFL
ncbi:NAD(+)/NADH kinase [Romboutsia lituseburensis]|uniref:NAD(+)/NADH kinase n=1 Tax=Romboutsia lituseburensis TaxID=1537 RepID=UPI00215AC272|nr:NAD(+)/NADH kinase [Romboutsia lituseburensis]MCR8746242.1 NAD(+)/NADH kinase [Romboutsia lituseburensis]